MNLEDMNKEDLELLSYTDLTNLILKKSSKPMNTPTIFRKICDLLEYSDSEYSEKIGDFYTSLTTDKRFVFLDSAEWDLKDNHAIPLVLDDDEELEDDLAEESELEDELEEEDVDVVIEDDDIENVEDEMDDLSLVDEEEMDDEK